MASYLRFGWSLVSRCVDRPQYRCVPGVFVNPFSSFCYFCNSGVKYYYLMTHDSDEGCPEPSSQEAPPSPTLPLINPATAAHFTRNDHKDRKIFVGGLTANTTNDSLYQGCSAFGEVSHCVEGIHNSVNGISPWFFVLSFHNLVNMLLYDTFRCLRPLQWEIETRMNQKGSASWSSFRAILLSVLLPHGFF